MRPVSPKVKIAFAGCVSPLGFGMEETRAALETSRDGIAPVRLFPVGRCHAKTAGQVDESLGERAASITPRARLWTRAAQMVLVAMEEAVHAGFKPDCVVMGTTGGGMTLGEDFYRAMASGAGVDSAARRVHGYFPQQPVQQAMEIFGFDAPVRIISNACASGTNALGLACQLIRSGVARRVLAGGYDALAELVFSGFDCLRAATPEKCRPFDANRTGLVLGEGAAVFCLEAGNEGSCFTGYGSATDTHHLTQPHPSGAGPAAAMRRALEDAATPPESVDYVNAHGTGTTFNDASEARAILAVCPHAPVSSTKGMTGHALGAAGAIEAAFCREALEGGFLPANINFTRTEEEFPLDIVANTARPTAARRIVSNSFGFGGANASIVMEYCG